MIPGLNISSKFLGGRHMYISIAKATQNTLPRQMNENGYDIDSSFNTVVPVLLDMF